MRGAVSGEARPERLRLYRLPLSLSSHAKGDLEREIVDLEREIVVGGRVGVGCVGLGCMHCMHCMHLVHRHGRLCLCSQGRSHCGLMNCDKFLIVLVQSAELGTVRAELGTVRAESGTVRAESGLTRAELGTGQVPLLLIAEDDVLRPHPEVPQKLLARRAEMGTTRANVPQHLLALAAAHSTSGGAVVGTALGSIPDLFAQDGA